MRGRRSTERKEGRGRRERYVHTNIVDLCTAESNTTRIQSAITAVISSKHLYVSMHVHVHVIVRTCFTSYVHVHVILHYMLCTCTCTCNYLLPSITMPPVAEDRTQ